MDLCATKTHGEREDEEADRLVRPSPKIKPPRRDLRREHTEAEDDPDLKADQNVDNDPDLSLNRKRTAWRVFARHILAKPRDNRVPAWDKKEKRRVDVSPETLAEGGDYEPYKDQDKQEGAGDETSTALQELMQDPATAAHFKELLDPSKQIGGIAEKTPTFPAARLFPKTTLPKGVETVGDLVKALRRMPKPDKKPKKKKAPPAAEAPPAEAPSVDKPKEEVPAEAPPVDKPKEEAPAAKAAPPPAEGAPAAKPAETTSEPEAPVGEKPPASAKPAKPAKPTPEDAAKAIAEELPRFELEGEYSADAAPTSKDMPDILEGIEVPEIGKTLAVVRLLGAQDPNMQRVLQDIANPYSDLGKRLQGVPDLESIAVEDAIPPLKGKKLPEGLKTLADLVEAAQEVHPAPPPRKLSKAEMDEADQLMDEAPLDAFLELSDRGIDMHPDEIRAAIQAHAQFAQRPPTTEERHIMISKVRGTGYYTDPMAIPAPEKGLAADGKTLKPFSQLSKEEQAAAWHIHRQKVFAQSIVARAALAADLQDKGFPENLARMVADMRLQPQHAKPEELAREAFEATLAAGASTGMPLKHRQDLLAELAEDPAAAEVAVGFMQAQDYHEAKRKYLGTDSDEAVSEYSSPGQIARGVVRAMQDLDAVTAQYPEGSAQQDTARLFRNRVMQRLKTLAPDKYQAVLGKVQQADADRYERLFKGYRKAKAKYEKDAAKYEKGLAKATKEHEKATAMWWVEVRRIMAEQAQQGGPYRAVPLPSAPEDPRLKLRVPMEPKEPSRPPSYLTPEEAADLRANLFKAASRSSYAVRKVMKRAVYHGVDPYPAGLKPYTSWLQAHQRDFSATDHAVLVESAQAWLKSNYLTANYVGAPRDTQLRAALDLAIRTTNGGAYAAGVTPPLYEAMLRDLADVPPGGTLLTIREAGSSYAPTRATTGDKTMTMPKFAAEQANGLLTRLDKIAHHIQANFKAWGMPFETAKQIVNDLDKTADEIEVTAFGQESFAKRQAEVIMKNPDEPYMSTFENPQQPRQVDADEPYMSAFKSDDSSGVHHGKAENGRPLAP